MCQQSFSNYPNCHEGETKVPHCRFKHISVCMKGKEVLSSILPTVNSNDLLSWDVQSSVLNLFGLHVVAPPLHIEIKCWCVML